MHAVRSCALLVAVALTLSVSAAKPAPAPQPPSALIAGTWTSTGPFPEPFDFLPNKLSFQRTFTVPAGGAWLWGDAKYANYLEMDCDHHYKGDVDPGLAEYTPLFTAGELPPPYDVCTFGNCYSCRLDWGGVKASSYLTTVSAPAFVPEGTRVITISTLNGGGNGDRLNLLIAQMNRSDLTSLTMFQALTDDDPSPASDTEVADRTFVANSEDRIPVVPVFHGSTGDFPGGPGVTYNATWDDGSVVAGSESAPKVLHGLTVVDVPIPKLTTGNHKFKLMATLPGGKTLTTADMTVFVYAQTIFLTYGTFNAKTGTDDLPKFVPGTDANGNDASLIDANRMLTPQVVQLSIVTGRATGSVTVTVDPTFYPGVAMNWPIPGGVEPDMDLGGGQLSLTFPIPKDHIVRLPLYVYDYGAAATIQAIVPYRKTTYKATRRVPLDDDRNGLPDAGWRVNGQHIDTTALTAAGDVDAQPGSRVGDGFSNYEEYRGFFVGGKFTRTDPNKKDLFVDMDDLVATLANGKTIIDKLPVTVHYLTPLEDSGIPLLPRAERTSPIVDVNRAGIPGATDIGGQRAVRIVYQDQHEPAYEDPVAGTNYKMHQMFTFGLTLPDFIRNVDTINSPLNLDDEKRGPDVTQWVELYPQTFANVGLHTDFSRQYFDAFGQEVPDCATLLPPDGTNCDDYRSDLQIIVPHRYAVTLPAPVLGNPLNTADWLTGDRHAELDLSRFPAVEWYSKIMTSCDSGTEVTLSNTEMDTLQTAVVAHETGHALAMPISADCHDMMYHPFAAPYPIITDYSLVDILDMVLAR